MGGRRGLTMIEALVVVAVLAAITALALPALEGWVQSARIDEAVAQIESGIASARAKARERGRPVEVRLTSELAAAPSKEQPREESDSAVDAVEIALPAGIQTQRTTDDKGDGGAKKRENEPASPEAGLSLAMCMPDGTVECAGAASLSIGGRTIDLTVVRWTGAVKAAERTAAAAKVDSAPHAADPEKAGVP
jgi:type II secretory pathway pseudopilin PulG